MTKNTGIQKNKLKAQAVRLTSVTVNNLKELEVFTGGQELTTYDHKVNHLIRYYKNQINNK